MKIVGGTFGTSGGAYLSNDGYLVIKGAKSINYRPGELVSLVAEQKVESKTSVLSILFGVVITIVLTVFFSLIGLVVGLLLTYFGSRYKSKDDVVNLEFTDGERVVLECTPRQVKKLVQFKG